MLVRRYSGKRVSSMVVVVFLYLSLLGFVGFSFAEGVLASEGGSLEAGDSTIDILYTGTANGLLVQCACPGKSGGLARRAQFIKQYRQEHSQVLVLDSGDNLPTRSDPLKSSYIFAALELIGYDAVTVGDQEFMSGCQFLLEAREDYHIPVVAADLKILCGDDSLLFPSYVIKEVGNHRLAILGVTFDASHFSGKQKKVEAEFFPWQEVLSRYLSVLEEKADLIIVLSHLGTELDLKMAAQFKGIDLIVGGHGGSLINKPLVAGETLIVHPGPSGQKVGVLTLSLDENGKIVGYQNQLTSLTTRIKSDAEVVALDREYKQALKERNKALLMQKQNAK